MSMAYNCSYEQFTFVKHAAGDILHTYLTRDYWVELVYKFSAPCYVANSVLSFSSFLLFILVFFPRSLTVWGVLCFTILHTFPHGSLLRFLLPSWSWLPMSHVCEISKPSAGFSHAISRAGRYSRVKSNRKLPFLSVFVFSPGFWLLGNMVPPSSNL